MSATTEILDYDETDISGQKFICPMMARLFMTAGREKSKNEIEFRDYRKFGSDVNIQYGAEAPPPPPESRTEEEPATFSSTTTAQSSGATPGQTSQQKPATASTKPGSNSANPWALPTPPPPPPQ